MKKNEQIMKTIVGMGSFGHAKLRVFVSFTWELQSWRVFRHLRKRTENNYKFGNKMAPKMMKN